MKRLPNVAASGYLVRRQCLAFAQRPGQVHGVWGGPAEEERNQETWKADPANASSR